jgi:hypothetical protein
MVAHDKGRANVLDSPRRREAAWRHYYLRQQTNNSRSDNDQDQQDCENDPKLAHVALMISTQYRALKRPPRKFCEKILDPKRSDKADGLQHLPSITVKAKVVGVGTDIAQAFQQTPRYRLRRKLGTCLAFRSSKK